MAAQVDRRPSRPPQYLTRFIGRRRELAQLSEQLTTKRAARLITLTGVGGSGKTRLAAELARVAARPGRDTQDAWIGYDVCWVSLSSLTDPALVPQTVAAALGLREARGRSPASALLAAVRETHLLLVLDNCEHLAGACGALARQLLDGCPHLVILATSRAPLNVTGEAIYPVPPLQTAEVGTGAGGTHLAQSEAAQLFLDRAAMMLSGYQISRHNAKRITQICQRLGGLPLAIELAASWIRVLSVQDILKEIEESLDFLSSWEPTLAPRHRSMRAVLDTSLRRLSGKQQRVFADLAVFRGSFGRDAAEVVARASLPSLAALVENSLLQRLPGDEWGTRYQLHEVVRQYAQDRLEAYGDGRGESARQQHLRFYLELAERAAESWDTAQETAWLNRLKVDQENLHTAVRRAVAQSQAEEALRLSAALFAFWIYNTPPEGYAELLDRSLALPWDDGSTELVHARAKTLCITGFAAVATSDYAQAMECFQVGETLYRRLDDARGIAWSQRGYGFAKLLSGKAKEAETYVEKSLALCRSSGDAWGEAWSVFDLGNIAFSRGAIEQARRLLEEASQRFEAMGTLFGNYRALILLGDIRRRQSCWSEALAFYSEALRLEQENRFGQFGADLLEGLARIAAAQRLPEISAQLFGAGDAWRQTFGQARSFFYEPGYQRIQEAARAQLEDKAWSSGYEAGRRLTSEQAMDAARQAVPALESAALEPHSAGLTGREVEVLGLVAEGLKNQEIADQLVVSPRTVHAHLRSIYGKLGVHTRTAAALEALERQLV